MKKLLILILALCMVLPLAACDSGEKKPDEDNKPATVQAWTMHGYEKTVVSTAPKGTLSNEYTVYLSKGETEGCQLAVYSDKALKNTTFTMKSGENEFIKTAIFSLDKSHKVGRKYYTDSTIPYYGGRIMVEEKTVVPFMVEFTTDENTPAGDYEYVYEFKDREKKVLATFKVTVHVWDFALPKDKTFATAVGAGGAWIVGAGGDYEKWYNDILNHNMSCYNLPFDILDERADVYMSDPRVTSFMVPVPKNEDKTINEAKLLEYYNKLKTNTVWLEKAFFYPIDEPRDLEMLAELKEWEKKLTKLCPEIEICAPFYTNIPVGANKDQTEEMAEYTDLWCPKLCLWDDERSYGDFGISNPKSFEQRMNEQIAKGDRMWCYVCNAPDDPYAQMFIDTKGENQRLMFWQMYQRDIEGFLYWSVTYYGYKEGPHPPEGTTVHMQDPWKTVNTKIPNDKGQAIYGCGFLFYPGSNVGISGPVPSIRAKIVRDGCDDIEMFRFAEQYLGKDWLIAKTKEGTPTLTEFVNADKFAALRIEIGNAIEAAVKGNQ